MVKKELFSDPGKLQECPRPALVHIRVECLGCGDKAMWPMCQECADLFVGTVDPDAKRGGFCTECLGEVIVHPPVPMC